MTQPLKRIQDGHDREYISRRAFVGVGGILTSAAALGVAAQQGDAAGNDTKIAVKHPENQPAESATVQEQALAPAASAQPPFMTPSGVVPKLTVTSGLKGPRSECGIGALVPWADRLWLISYVASKARSGSGTGLYEIDDSFTIRKRPESVVGTYANRFVHNHTRQLIIGPHIIDADCNVRTFKNLINHRLTATMAHLTDQKNKVYFLGMEGEFWEADVRTLRVKWLFTLQKELELPKGYYPHYKGGYTGAGRVVVANNTYFAQDNTEGVSTGGRLAEWNGMRWKVIERTAFCDVNGRNGGIFATGWDRASVIFKVFAGGKWSTYRLPKASHCHDHCCYTEWPRIREIETERFLMDMHGMFYELPRQVYGGHVWGIKPICQHLRMIPDYCTWRGMLVLAGDQVAACAGNMLVGEPQSNLWFGVTDDLWKFGKPQGWGGPWYETQVKTGRPSDPFLMTGFEHKCLHLSHNAASEVDFVIEVDFLGNGSWKPYETIRVGSSGYAHHEFPTGFSAHWVRVEASKSCTASAHFVYT